jgi:hypothetical protein
MRLLKRSLLSVPLLALALVLIGLPAAAFGSDNDRARFSARLIGFNEVPSINSDGSASLRLTLKGSEIDFELNYHNLSGPPGAAHIHFGQARTNGGVMVFFCGGGGKPACPQAASGTVTGTIVAGDVGGGASDQGIAAGDMASVQRAIRAGAAYANMHTAKFGSGEIRGQIAGSDR